MSAERELRHEAALYAATVDRTDTPRLMFYDTLPTWALTKWHQPRTSDRALAKCSSRIVLNTEDMVALDDIHAPARADLCKRCFR